VPVSIQLFGDSINYGETRATPGGDPFRVDDTPQAVLQRDMDARFGAGAVVVTTDAIPGSTAKMLIDGDTGLWGGLSYQAWPLGATGDIVLMDYGINDYLSGLSAADFTAQLKQLAAARSVVFETPLPANGDVGFAAAVREVATETGEPLIDTSAYVQSLGNWSSYLGDGIHPNDAGYQLLTHGAVSPAVAKLVAPLLCVKG
jgi:lysophospholipase L1-like esterase